MNQELTELINLCNKSNLKILSYSTKVNNFNDDVRLIAIVESSTGDHYTLTYNKNKWK